jgi:hypothetical protein
VLLRVYDPNYALRDDLTFSFNARDLDGRKGIVYSTGESVRGFFHTAYRPPGFAWCSYLFGLHH